MPPFFEDDWVGEVIRAGPVHKIAEMDFGGPLHSLVLTLDVFSSNQMKQPVGKYWNIQRKPGEKHQTS